MRMISVLILVVSMGLAGIVEFRRRDLDEQARQLEAVRAERDRVKHQVTRLEVERARLTAPARIERLARELGLRPLAPEQRMSRVDDGELQRRPTADAGP